MIDFGCNLWAFASDSYSYATLIAVRLPPASLIDAVGVGVSFQVELTETHGFRARQPKKDL